MSLRMHRLVPWPSVSRGRHRFSAPDIEPVQAVGHTLQISTVRALGAAVGAGPDRPENECPFLGPIAPPGGSTENKRYQ